MVGPEKLPFFLGGHLKILCAGVARISTVFMGKTDWTTGYVGIQKPTRRIQSSG